MKMFKLSALVYTLAAIALVGLMAMRPPVEVTTAANQTVEASTAIKTDTKTTAVQQETNSDTEKSEATTQASPTATDTTPAENTEKPQENADANDSPLSENSDTTSTVENDTTITPSQAVENAANKEKQATSIENNAESLEPENKTTPEKTPTQKVDDNSQSNSSNVIDTPLDALTGDEKKNVM